jgi:hypothetical protein
VPQFDGTEQWTPGRREIADIEPFAELGEHLRVRISTVGGRVIAFTVQYETLVGDRWFPVVRYDSQHGTPHRDTLDRQGDLVGKLWINRTMKDTVQFALADIWENWRHDKAAFEENEA